MSRLLLIVQPENQHLRQVDLLTSFLDAWGHDPEEIVLYLSADIRSTAIFDKELPGSIRTQIRYQSMPSLNDAFNKKQIFDIQNGDHFLISGTKLHLACLINEIKNKAANAEIFVVCVHEKPDHSSFDFHTYTSSNGSIHVEQNTISRNEIVSASRLLAAKSYSFDVYGPKMTLLTRAQQRLLRSEMSSPREDKQKIKPNVGKNFEIVLAHKLSNHPHVIETLVNCELKTAGASTAREEDIVCTTKDGKYLFISCKFGKEGSRRELNRLANVAISRNLQPREKWLILYATRHSKLDLANRHIKNESFNVHAVSISTIDDFLSNLD